MPLSGVLQWREFLRQPWPQLWTLFHGSTDARFLYPLTAGIGLELAGANHFGLIFISIFYHGLLICSVYGIVRRIGTESGARLAAWSIAFMPAPLIWSHLYSPAIGQMAIPAFGVYLSVYAEGFRRLWPWLVFAILAALSLRFGETVSDSVQMMMIFGGVGVFGFFVEIVRNAKERRRAILFGGAILALFALLLNYNYLWHAYVYMQNEGFQLSETRYKSGNIFLFPGAILAYPALLWDTQIGPLLSLALLGSLICLFRKPRLAEGVGLVYFLIPLLILTAISKKNFHYFFSALPGAAVLLGLAASRLKESNIHKALLSLFVLAGTIYGIKCVFLPEDAADPQRSPFYFKYFEHTGIVEARINRDDLLNHIASQTVEFAKQNPGTSLLIIASSKEMPSVGILRLLLELENWHGPLMMYDPYLQNFLQINSLPSNCLPSPQCSPDASIKSFDPDFIVFFPKGRKMEQLRTHGLDPTFANYFSNGITLSTWDPLLPNGLLSAWENCLSTIQWPDYRSRRYVLATGGDLIVYDRLKLKAQLNFPGHREELSRPPEI